jgi:hypothetical protein
MTRTAPCPKCGRRLRPSGLVSVDGEEGLPVYQCDECTTAGEVLGVKMETALTFCIDKNGRVFDPSELDDPFSKEN